MGGGAAGKLGCKQKARGHLELGGGGGGLYTLPTSVHL